MPKDAEEHPAPNRTAVLSVAGRVLRSEELEAGEKEAASGFLRANPAFGNPHVVRCPFCHATRTLFRGESEAPFQRIAHGWRCELCEVTAASQEVKF